MIEINTYKTKADFKTAKDYLKYMYQDTKGFITKSQISSRYYETFSFADRLINRNNYHNLTDVFISMNSFLTRYKRGDENSGRKVNNIKRLNALYVDIDCYKIGFTQQQVLLNLQDNYFNRKIPMPTFVINSGRGLYLIWKINEDRNALPRWQRVQNYLFEQCKIFNADPQALDAARIFRLPYSINSKNNETVSIMQFNDVNYTLYEIIKEYDIKLTKTKKSLNKIIYPFGQATEKQRRIAQWQASKFGLELPDFTNYKTTFDFIKSNSTCKQNKETKPITAMLDGRVNDLFKLFSMRKGGDCNREYALFLCRLWVGERTNDFNYALEKTKDLNRSLDVPFTDRYVETRTKSAETKLRTGKTYKYSVSKLIKVLKITEEEQKKLKYLCDKQPEAQARKKANRKAYLTRLKKSGQTTKNEKLKARRETVALMIIEGKVKTEICTNLNLSKRTYDRDKAAIVKNNLINRMKEEKNKSVNNLKILAKRHLKTLKNAKKTLVFSVSPFFKHLYYKRIPFGYSACVFRESMFIFPDTS